ncbi:hypothetical protein PAXINDRAFT_166274 [Paxillus involutus ATCC 200175]|nr:hypothetical protein PAXINDRAFT_166274 [Paxillus involutus ATCC 200175]
MSFFGNNQGKAATGSSIFGNTTGAPATTGTSATTATGPGTTTTGNTPSLFGGGMSNGTNLFGNPSSSGTNIFGQPSPAAGTPSSIAPPSTPSLFGATTTTPASNPGSSLFSAPPASTSAQTPSLFGNIGGAAGNSTTTQKPSLFVPLTSNTTSTSTPNATTSASGASSLFSLKPAESSTTAATVGKPPSNFFPTPATSGATSGSALPGGSLFGNLPKPGDTSSGSTSGSLFSGSLFGKKPDATTATATPTTTTPAPTSAFSLGGTFTTIGANNNATPSATTAAPTSNIFGNVPKTDSTEKKDGAPAASPAFGLFGNRDMSSEKKDATPTPASTLFGAQPATTTSTTPSTTLGMSALAPKDSDKPKDGTPLITTIAVPPPSILRGKTIEEIVNKWTSDLDNHIREFNKLAGEVAVWDRALMENGNNLAAIYSHVLAVEREQSDIEQALDHIERQQSDLSSTLDTYERSAEEILGSQGGSLRALDTGPADTERDKNYMLATELHAHLDDLSGSLTQMIDSVNALSLTPAGNGSVQHGSEDPMVQISQILSSHLESLQWIDGALREVEGNVNEVERRVRDAGINTTLGSSTSKQRGFGLSR